MRLERAASRCANAWLSQRCRVTLTGLGRAVLKLVSSCACVVCPVYRLFQAAFGNVSEAWETGRAESVDSCACGGH